ncbi:MAG: FtsX-like permease family protein [Desulfobacteraceae bacterium]|nr:MAG: FtsX-like permease family protein [Desulfobacteraceae bacterium]
MLWMTLGVRDLLKNKGFSFFFVLNLSLGLAGFIAIHSFGRSLDRHFDTNLKEILTADLVVAANRAIAAKDLERINSFLGNDYTHSRQVSFYSMIRTTIRNQAHTRLVRVMAIDNSYPLYGAFEMAQGSTPTDLQTRPYVFMSTDTAYALGLEPGSGKNSTLDIGEQAFILKDHVVSDPENSLTSFSFAPRIYIGIDQLDRTGLIRYGSRIWVSHFYRLAPDTDADQISKRLKDRFSQLYKDQPPYYIYTSNDVNRRLGRLTRYFTSYMGLVSVVTLFLAGIATAYLFRGYLNLKRKEMAILMSVGGSKQSIWFYISFQLILLGTAASFLATLASFFIIPAFPMIFKGLIPDNVILSVSPSALALAMGLGMAGSMIFCLPVFIQIFDIKPLMLLRGTPDTATSWLKQVLSLLPGVTAFVMISIYAAGKLKTGLVFVGGFTLAIGVLFLIGQGFVQACKRLSQSRTPVVKIAFRNLYRNQWTSLSIFVTIALGTFLISLIPQVQNGLQTEIIKPDGLKIPVFFLVDIQDEQKAPFVAFMEKQDAIISNLSPMVRGRILKRNNQPFHQRSDESRRRRGRRLEFNFSFRETLDVSETITQGDPISTEYWDWESNTPFDISVEESFAKENKIALNDILEFEIQGIPFTGQVKNFRKVRWNSFQPNFFLLFQNGVLNDAPKTHLAAISQVPMDQRQQLKNRIVDQFPNISVIDVTQMANTILGISNKLSLSIRFMAWLAIAAGLISIFSIARHEAWKNRNQINLLKVLGSEYPAIRAITLIEFGVIGFAAALFAILLSYGFSFGISWYFFDNLWQINGIISILILILTTLICMGTALSASRKVMNTKPIHLLTSGT